MKSSFTHLFYIKKSKADVNQKANIYLRITVNGKRSELSIDRKVPIDKWNQDANRVRGFSKEAQEINQYIDLIINKINKIHQRFVESEKRFTSIQIRDAFLGKNKNEKMLLTIFQDHNNQVEKLVGKEFAEGTALRYRTAKSHIEEFIKFEYKVNDIAVTEVDHKFITGFEYYLKTERNCAHNTAIKYITNFKKVIRIAYANGWITKDPFFNWKARLKTVDRQFLSELEIEDLINKQFDIPRLEQVRDLFIFSCFTGLAYADVQKLKKENIVIGIDGNKWINTKRKKTDTISNIPLLPTSLTIIEKYQTHKNIVNSDKLLPVLSNQKMNAYLKEIADLCGITKNLTFHLARHTFATTITLTNGVPIESVSKMLGHKSLKTTQHYAKIIDRKVSDDMNVLKEKLNIGKKNKLDSSEKRKKSI
ncbi:MULTISPECIES: site-specific integrase [Flavobacteriaceae]|uniref:Site-specific integrase n=2 Tax=Flavobacteriaceae TaxID=49546 RepID=A0A4Y8AQ54_9FLAO|nr:MULTISPECIES: site-specific integrase [Flavobacteriaceae]TEW72925.1 site-specific integrase [Gramella jeungdoensis]GGK48498.1 transposase [Lutibacter litoralis]